MEAGPVSLVLQAYFVSDAERVRARDVLHLREFETFGVELVSSASYENKIKK
jgi:hypothetical protein